MVGDGGWREIKKEKWQLGLVFKERRWVEEVLLGLFLFKDKFIIFNIRVF